MSSSREQCRDELKTLLETELVGAGKPVKTVSESKIKSLEGITPLITILSDGTHRVRFTGMGDRPLFYFVLTTFVQQGEGAWTNAMAEDTLDSIEAGVAGVFETNRCGTEWDTLEYAERSKIIEVSVAGVPYYIELTPIIARLTKS